MNEMQKFINIQLDIVEKRFNKRFNELEQKLSLTNGYQKTDNEAIRKQEKQIEALETSLESLAKEAGKKVAELRRKFDTSNESWDEWLTKQDKQLAELKAFKDTLIDDTVNAVDKVENEIKELKEEVHSITVNIMNWQDAWVKVSNSYLTFNDKVDENREVLRELIDRITETLSGEIEDQSLEWFITQTNELLAKLDGEKTSAPLHPSPPLNTKPFTPKEEIDPELMKRIMSHEIEPMRKDGEKPLIMIMCNECDLYGECDHQGAYKKDGKWCYE